MRGIIFAGTAVTRQGAIGSLYRLEHGGEWKIPTGMPENASVQALTVHPTDGNTIYAATRAGIFVSGDAGLNWRKLLASGEREQFWSVVVHPKNHDTLFAGCGPVGFYRSDDAGKSWRKSEFEHPERFKITFGASRVMRIAFHPVNPNIMYAVAEINGFYFTRDGGEHWQAGNEGVEVLSHQTDLLSREVTDDYSEGMYDAHSVCTTPAMPDTAFYVCRMGIFTTTDFGDNLRDLQVKRFAPFRYTRDLRVSPSDPRTMYACFSIASRSETGSMYRSHDLGESWSRVDLSMQVRSTIMGFGTHVSEPGGVASVTRHGQVFYTMDDCATWTERQLPENAGDAFCGAIL